MYEFMCMVSTPAPVYVCRFVRYVWYSWLLYFKPTENRTYSTVTEFIVDRVKHTIPFMYNTRVLLYFCWPNRFRRSCLWLGSLTSSVSILCDTAFVLKYCILLFNYILCILFVRVSVFFLYKYLYLCFLLEYIVTFHGYYLNETRYNYISAALKSSGVENWKILDRKNAASKYPSDFDVLIVIKNR